MATRITHFWVADAFASDTTLQATGDRRTTDAYEALARIHSLCHGAHASENEHRRGTSRSADWMGEIIQPRGNRKSSRFDRPQAAGLSHQHFDLAPLLPGHLFPPTWTFRVDQDDRRKQANDFQVNQARSQFGAEFRRATCGAPAGAGTAALKPSQSFAKDRHSNSCLIVATTGNGNEDLH